MKLHVETQGWFPRLAGFRTVVLHDRSGRIHHVHQAVVFAGAGTPPTPTFLEAVARRLATGRAGLPADLLALHLEERFPGPGPYRVDVARGVLVRTGSAPGAS